MLSLKRIDHFAFVVDDLDLTAAVAEDFLGCRPAGDAFEGEAEDGGEFVGRRFTFSGQGSVGLEIIAARGEGSSLRRGFHHLAVQVEDLEAAHAAVRARGDECWTGPDLRGAGAAGRVSYLHPDRGGQGLLWELSDAPGWEREVFEDDAQETLGIAEFAMFMHATADADRLGAWYREVPGFRAEPLGAVYDDAGRRKGPFLDLHSPADQGGGAQFDTIDVRIVEAESADSPAGRVLASGRSPFLGLYFRVRDWDRAVGAMERRGIPLTDDHRGDWEHVGPWRAGGISPRYTGGIPLRFWASYPGAP